MKARNIMTSPVVSVEKGTWVQDIAKLMVDRKIAAVPVVEAGKVVGIVSEQDMMHRAEARTQRRLSWWSRLFANSEQLAAEYVKENGRTAEAVMSSPAVTAPPDISLRDLAMLMERKWIKHVPIVDGAELIGIVSRADLVRVVASSAEIKGDQDDASLRARVQKAIASQQWSAESWINVTVGNGTIYLWGMVRSDTIKKAVHACAESIDGVRAVVDNITVHRLETLY